LVVDQWRTTFHLSDFYYTFLSLPERNITMIWRRKNKKDKEEERPEPRGDFIFEVEEMLNHFMKIQEEMLKDLVKSGGEIYTRRITLGPDGQPKVEEFVNGQPANSLKGHPLLQESGEAEVIESKDKVVVTVEIPGVKREELKVTLKNKVKLVVDKAGERVEVNLPGPVEPESVRLKNGVLVCTFRKGYKESVEELKVEG
jgi:HSP20 family protein